MRFNPLLDSDSYKYSHGPWQYPSGTKASFSYFESRGGMFDRTVFFGLQYYLKEYLTRVPTQADVDEAAAFMEAHGEPFNREGFERVAKLGYWPLRIKAVPEGSVVPTHNVLFTVESTDPETFWLASWVETMLCRMWYPITVATLSWHCRKMILSHLRKSADNPEAEIDFKLHDFGARGVSSRESAGIGGMAHLVNFKGSDTVEGIRFANHYYNCPMSAFSIPAAEHSTITSWGREHEIDAYRNMLTQFAKPGKLVACVSDSYDLYNVVENVWGGSLHEEVKKSGATLVIRPDSGTPHEVVLKVLQILDRKVGMTVNSKGFKVLPNYYRVIQGDGVNPDSINHILNVIEEAGYSASNLAFGMGGALLQQVNRDTNRFAYKCSAIQVGNEWRDVYKQPATDPGKDSKAGRLTLTMVDGQYKTVREEDHKFKGLLGSLLWPVFENGRLGEEIRLDAVRALAAKGA